MALCDEVLDQGPGLVISSGEKLHSSGNTVQLQESLYDFLAFFPEILAGRTDEYLIAFGHLSVYENDFNAGSHRGEALGLGARQCR